MDEDEFNIVFTCLGTSTAKLFKPEKKLRKDGKDLDKEKIASFTRDINAYRKRVVQEVYDGYESVLDMLEKRVVNTNCHAET